MEDFVCYQQGESSQLLDVQKDESSKKTNDFLESQNQPVSFVCKLMLDNRQLSHQQ